MRKAMEEIPYDLSKPVTKTIMTGSNCFGKEWNPTTTECSMCGMSDLCCIIFRKTTLTTKSTKIERQKGTFLDITDFAINKDKLAAIVKEGDVKYSEVFEMVNQKTQCKDAKLITMWIEVFMNDYSFENIEGILCARS